MNTKQVFVFGTLRVEASRWARAAEVDEPIVNCMARGVMYSNGGYPYVDFDGTSAVYGDVLTFDTDHPMYEHMCRVEIGAGYELRDVDVRTPYGIHLISAWDATKSTKRNRLPLLPVVPSGDWLVVERALNSVY